MYKFFTADFLLEFLSEVFTKIIKDGNTYYENDEGNKVNLQQGCKENNESHLWFLRVGENQIILDFNTADLDDVAEFFNFINKNC